MSIYDIINELKLFSEKIITFEDPATTENIFSFENQFKFKLPDDYKKFILTFNGVSLMGSRVYGVGKEKGANSINENYIFEHEEVANPMPIELIPFAPDGYGNHYCFNTKAINGESCEIVFWQHDYAYSEIDLPEVINSSFAEWLKEVVIDWTLEDYGYDGERRST